jgi:DegV family protein with EDD domain
MSQVTIITDSTAYLPQEYVQQYSIRVIPLTFTWDGNTYRDGIDMSPDEFYTRLSRSSSFPTTSQTSVHAYEELFRSLIAEGKKQILVLPISSGISGSVFSAQQARTMFPDAEIEVLDTRLVSMALSFQVLAAARAAEQGASLQECKQVAEKAYDHIGVYFTVDTLEYLSKGGRIGSAKRLLGTALNIKPLLMIQDGKIELVQSVISKRKAVERMVQLVEHGIDGRTPVHISVFHALAEKEAAELLERVSKQFNAVESILSHVSPVVGSHVGPGTISIAYMAGM